MEVSNNNVTNEKLQKVKEGNLEFAKKFDNGTYKIDKLLEALVKKRMSSTERIEQYLQDPVRNADNLQSEIEGIMLINGVLKEILVYKSNMLTYDHYLLCRGAKTKDKDKYMKSYRNACERVEQYNIKFNVRWWIKDTLKSGELFLYKKSTTKDISYVKIPNEFCKITSAIGVVQKYAINLTKITDEILEYFPKEIQQIYKKYKAGKIPQEKLDNGYYQIDSPNAVAFSVDFLSSKSIPYYTSVLRDLSMLNDMQTLKNDASKIESFKLIQMIIPTDDEGNIMADGEEAQMYLDALKTVLPLHVPAVGMPYKLESFHLGDSQAQLLEHIGEIKDNVFDNSAINNDIFSGEKSNNQAVIYGADVDSMLSINLLEQIRVYLNEDFKNDKALSNYKIVFVDSTVMNKSEKIKLAVSNLATWNSRLQTFAYMGLEPKEALDTLETEDMLDLDSKIKPLMTSHTASGSVGRPSVSEGDNPNGVGQAQN